MRIAFHTLGCKVNQYETEAMKEAFVSRGATIVGEDESADVYVVNTCTVTNIADRKSRQYIRRMKGVNPEAYVVVTGCYAQVESEEVASLPEVDLVVGNSNKSRICDIVCGVLSGKVTVDENDKTVVRTGGDIADTDHMVLPRNELTEFEDMGLVVSSESGMTRAYIKIQEGCDRFCAYCLIPFARGPVRSRPLDEILEEARMLLDAGYRELVLTGINTALYGTEPDFSINLYDEEGHIYPGYEELVEHVSAGSASHGTTANAIAPIELVLARLNAINRDFRIRLSSLEPTVVDKNDVERIIRYDKLCHHLHLSAQSGSTHVLGLMNRHYTKDDYLDIVNAIHEYDPCYNITTDIIVGFSGETEEDFQDSIDVTRQAEFGKVHIFRYSKRKGTVGAKLPDEVPSTVKAERAKILAAVADDTSRQFIEKNIEHSKALCDNHIEDDRGNCCSDNHIENDRGNRCSDNHMEDDRGNRCIDNTYRVLIEEEVAIGRKKYLTGYTGNYIRVYIEHDEQRETMKSASLQEAERVVSLMNDLDNSSHSNNSLIGNFVQVRLTEPFKDGCLAVII